MTNWFKNGICFTGTITPDFFIVGNPICDILYEDYKRHLVGWRAWPILAEGLAPRPFKPHMECGWSGWLGADI